MKINFEYFSFLQYSLDLDAWINDPPSSSSSSESADDSFDEDEKPNIFIKDKEEKVQKFEEPTEEDLERVIIENFTCQLF